MLFNFSVGPMHVNDSHYKKRRSTPVRCGARATTGFSVLQCLGRACTLAAPTSRASPRVAVSSQALKNAPPATFFTAPSPHPKHCCACRGPIGRKNPPPTAEQHRQPDRAWSVDLNLACMGYRCCSAVAEGFSGRRPLARVAVRGVRRRPGNGHRRRRVA